MEGYTGEKCDEEIIECYPNPCGNGGTCIVSPSFCDAQQFIPSDIFSRTGSDIMNAHACQDTQEITVRWISMIVVQTHVFTVAFVR